MARILFFGKLADLAGRRDYQLSLPEGVDTVAALSAHLATLFGSLAEELAKPSIRYVVNEEICNGDHAVLADDEIAFLPPVSGG